ncbi:hypothetical protein RCL1_001782 [Eukaryota sp. TZLM3-RCL]
METHYSKAGKQIHAALHRSSRSASPRRSISSYVSNLESTSSQNDLTPRKAKSPPKGTSSFLSSPRKVFETKEQPAGYLPIPSLNYTRRNAHSFAIKPRLEVSSPRECQYSHNVASCEKPSPRAKSPSLVSSASFKSSPRPSLVIPTSRSFHGWYDYSMEPVSPRKDISIPLDRQTTRPDIISPSKRINDAKYNVDKSFKVTKPRLDIGPVPLERQSPRQTVEIISSIANSPSYNVKDELTRPRILAPNFDMYSPRSGNHQNVVMSEHIYDTKTGEKHTKPNIRIAEFAKYQPRVSEFDVKRSNSPDRYYDVSSSLDFISPSKTRFIPFDQQSPRTLSSASNKNAPDKYYDYSLDPVSPRSPRVVKIHGSPRFNTSPSRLVDKNYDPKYDIVSPRVRVPSLKLQTSRDQLSPKSSSIDLIYDVPSPRIKSSFLTFDRQTERPDIKLRSASPDKYYDVNDSLTRPRVRVPKI